MKYTGLVITGVVAAGFVAMFTLQSSDKIVNKEPTIDTTSTIVMVEDDYNYDSLNNILDWYEHMVPGGTRGYYYQLHTETDLYKDLVKDTEQGGKIIATHRYIFDYKELAKAESKQFGIPASIILAQGILESNSGLSILAARANNHFGIKCFSKTCKKGHCVNQSDDTHKDFFRIYENVWSSYRDHSEFLMKPRYKHLLKLKKSDYKGWAKGLSKAGYATDSDYAKKLINVIEKYELHKL
jgi:flagellum-specific peptidoglycan hydrolase FlgJ